MDVYNTNRRNLRRNQTKKNNLFFCIITCQILGDADDVDDEDEFDDTDEDRTLFVTSVAEFAEFV